MKTGSSYLLAKVEKEEPFSLTQIVCGKVSYLFPAVTVTSKENSPQRTVMFTLPSFPAKVTYPLIHQSSTIDEKGHF